MHGSVADIDRLLEGMKAQLASLKRCRVIVFPPWVYLASVVQQLEGMDTGVGVQDVDERDEGAVTGGVSARMARDVGCQYSLVGHSERRALFAESDETVAAKYMRCQDAGLTSLVCVGETLQEREEGRTSEVVRRQLGAVVSAAGKGGLAGVMVAYEPVWAIGTGQSATPVQAEEVHLDLRRFLADVDQELASRTNMLYGGSVTPENAASLFAMENVDGVLVGGASLQADSFAEICRAAEKAG